MKKIIFLFPGVGSQYVGMSKSLYDNFTLFQETIKEADEILQVNLVRMCLSPGNKVELNRLENAQTALLAFSVATYRVFMQEIGIKPDYCMGHSLGEYSALCCAGVIRFPDALRLVKERGTIIDEVVPGIDGTMAWVVNLDTKIVDTVCKEAWKEGEEVYVSAFDSPYQASISGHTAALMKVARELEKKGAIVYPLRLNGPFHSPLMKEAAEKMKTILCRYNYEPGRYPVIANRNALPYDGPGSVVDNLSLQLVSFIHWRASLESLLEKGAGIAVEIGPKNVLKFLIKKNTDSMETYTTDKVQDLELIREELRGGNEILMQTPVPSRQIQQIQ
jgi:[acyl-carrier-protein] S-malonyltransferase